MNLSLNEIEATAKRAARGAGYGWGLAEEAGKATRWLCAQGLDGVAALARLLERDFAGHLDRHSPDCTDAVWTGVGDLCPLITGAALSDRADAVVSGTIGLRRIAVPLLLLPFAANMARRGSFRLTVDMDGLTAVTDGAQLSLEDACSHYAENIRITRVAVMLPARPRQTRAEPAPAGWDTINQFAHLTYAPATEESRLLGAGAGLSDND